MNIVPLLDSSVVSAKQGCTGLFKVGVLKLFCDYKHTAARGSGGMLPQKSSEIRHSEITSEVSFFDFLREAKNTCNS